jgi:hypothetical protein
MAEWLYRIHRIEIPPTTDFDGQIEAVLHDYGTKGWELFRYFNEIRHLRTRPTA